MKEEPRVACYIGSLAEDNKLFIIDSISQLSNPLKEFKSELINGIQEETQQSMEIENLIKVMKMTPNNHNSLLLSQSNRTSCVQKMSMLKNSLKKEANYLVEEDTDFTPFVSLLQQ